jgi:hypothetical protein
MAYSAKKFGVQESAFGNMGIPPHDHVKNTYTGNELTTVEYFRGGQQDSGKLVAKMELTYDGSGNLLTVTRVV